MQQSLERDNRGRAKEIIRQEIKLKQFLDCLAQNMLWISHTKYDRNCDTEFGQVPEGAL